MPRGGKREGAGRKPIGGKPIHPTIAPTIQLRPTLAETCRTLTLEMLEVQREIANDPRAPASARAACANSILDRGWGRPAQQLELTGKDGERLFDPSRYTDAELADLRRLVEKSADAGSNRSGNGATQH